MARNTTETTIIEFNKIITGTSVKGDLKSNGDIRIDGTLTGTLTTEGKLVLGPTGEINGKIFCKNAEIMGQIDGEIKVEELLSLKSSSSFKGEIVTSKISIESGAKINGTISMEQFFAIDNISTEYISEV